MIREKYNLVDDLKKTSIALQGKDKTSLVGLGDFSGGNNVTRAAMNIKHHSQKLTIDDPEHAYVFEGKEFLMGKYSSFYTKTDLDYEVKHIVKKYEVLLKGKSRFALYFLYNKKHDKWKVVERQEVENLTENFGFEYKNDFIDNAQVGEMIPKDTVVSSSTSYDEYGNLSTGVNGRILFGVHPAVQDDAIIISESFAKRMITNQVSAKTIPIKDDTVMLNLYGDENEYKPLPEIGDIIKDGIIGATRSIKETRMLSNLRDEALREINEQSDDVFYADGEIIDINVYCNNPNIKENKTNKQILRYYKDTRHFYTEVYKVCKSIINGYNDKDVQEKVDKNINRWMRKSMEYLDSQAQWLFNDNVFSNLMVEVLVRNKEPLKIGRKITGKHGNKTVVCSIWKDEEMPYLAAETYTDEFGVVHASGVREKVELITNPLAIINRTIPMALYEPSISFILDRTRKHLATLDNQKEQEEFLFGVMRLLNPHQTLDLEALYYGLSDREKRKFMESSISIDYDGNLITNKGIYIRWEAFSEDIVLRDAILAVYDEYGDIIKPYDIFTPKPKWGRDIHIGQGCIGYQYILMLKQSGERGFSVRSAGAISDEGLPEKSQDSKIGKALHSDTPIRFGEYETPNFLVVTLPEDFALMTALGRSSIDGRRYLYEAIMNDVDENIKNLPESFRSRPSEILEVFLLSLGVKMTTIYDEDEYIGTYEHTIEVLGHNVNNKIIFCTRSQYYYLRKLQKTYYKWIRKNPNTIGDMNEVWSYMMDHLPFKKKHLTDDIIELFKENFDVMAYGYDE